MRKWFSHEVISGCVSCMAWQLCSTVLVFCEKVPLLPLIMGGSGFLMFLFLMIWCLIAPSLDPDILLGWNDFNSTEIRRHIDRHC